MSYQRIVPLTTDKPGRAVTVEAGDAARHRTGADLNDSAGGVLLEIGGRIGESEWTWLTLEEARAVALALDEAADSAGATTGAA